VKTKLYWWIAAVVLGLAFALLPSLSLRWYWIYPFPLIPSVFWMVVADAIRSQLLTGCIAFCLGPAMFLLASPALFRGEAKISRASLRALLALTVLEIADVALTRHGGYQYVPGRTLTNLTIVGSVIWLLALWLLFAAARVLQSYPWTLAYNFGLVLWLLVYAFPWLGEMP
jgi:hypothetical protein